jgi:hypothetical protein
MKPVPPNTVMRSVIPFLLDVYSTRCQSAPCIINSLGPLYVKATSTAGLSVPCDLRLIMEAPDSTGSSAFAPEVIRQGYACCAGGAKAMHGPRASASRLPWTPKRLFPEQSRSGAR